MANTTFVATLPPSWITGYPLVAFNNVAGTPLLLFDFDRFDDHTAVGFAIVNLGAVQLTVTPEASVDAVHPMAGPLAPVSFTVDPGYSYVDEYGIDLGLKPYWRLWVSGATSGQWGLRGIPRR